MPLAIANLLNAMNIESSFTTADQRVRPARLRVGNGRPVRTTSQSFVSLPGPSMIN